MSDFKCQISDKQKAFLIAAVDDRDRKIISASRRAATDARHRRRSDQDG
jgi:hypothetical protein